jgi:Flp pilus assembly protein CpaB
MDLLAAARSWLSSPTRIASRRRLVAAVLVGVAVLCGLRSIRPPDRATRSVWVAAHDLSGGAPLTAADIRTARYPPSDVPAGALPAARPIVGQVLGAPMRAGEPLTDVRLLSPALLAAIGSPGAVALPLRVADGPATLALVRAGDRIDVIAVGDPATATTGRGSVVVHDVRVLATPSIDSTTSTDDGGGVLVVAASPRQAATLAQVSATSRLSISVRRPA